MEQGLRGRAGAVGVEELPPPAGVFDHVSTGTDRYPPQHDPRLRRQPDVIARVRLKCLNGSRDWSPSEGPCRDPVDESVRRAPPGRRRSGVKTQAARPRNSTATTLSTTA